MAARKEINIFSVSFLDLLSGALGAVLLLFVIIPKNASTEGEIFGTDAELGVVCSWKENIDVDLYMENTANGDVCYFDQPQTDFASYLLDVVDRNEEDNRYELIYQYKLTPGKYKIYVNIYDEASLENARSATVSGYVVIFPSTRHEKKIAYRNIRLTRRGQNVEIGVLTVTDNDIKLIQP